jgi:hypothetical protein
MTTHKKITTLNSNGSVKFQDRALAPVSSGTPMPKVKQSSPSVVVQGAKKKS